MFIKLVKSIVVQGYPGVGVGVPFDCPVSIARDLIIEGMAEAVIAEEAPNRAVGMRATIEVREPEIENRDPEPVPVNPKRKKSALS
jgi:hypothetical protein